MTLRSTRGYRLGRTVTATGAALLMLLVVIVGGLLVSGYWEARHPNVWPPEVAGVSPDGRVELVTEDVEMSSFFRERASRVMLRWRGDGPARQASLGCFRPGELEDVAFTGPSIVELRWLAGRTTVIRFDPGTLALERCSTGRPWNGWPTQPTKWPATPRQGPPRSLVAGRKGGTVTAPGRSLPFPRGAEAGWGCRAMSLASRGLWSTSTSGAIAMLSPCHQGFMAIPSRGVTLLTAAQRT